MSGAGSTATARRPRRAARRPATGATQPGRPPSSASAAPEPAGGSSGPPASDCWSRRRRRGRCADVVSSVGVGVRDGFGVLVRRGLAVGVPRGRGVEVAALGGGRACGRRRGGRRRRLLGRRGVGVGVACRVRGRAGAGPYVAGRAVPDHRDVAAGRDRQRARAEATSRSTSRSSRRTTTGPSRRRGRRVHARVVGGQAVDLADEAGEALDVGERCPGVLEQAVGRAAAAVGRRRTGCCRRRAGWNSTTTVTPVLPGQGAADAGLPEQDAQAAGRHGHEDRGGRTEPGLQVTPSVRDPDGDVAMLAADVHRVGADAGRAQRRRGSPWTGRCLPGTYSNASPAAGHADPLARGDAAEGDLERRARRYRCRSRRRQRHRRRAAPTGARAAPGRRPVATGRSSSW